MNAAASPSPADAGLHEAFETCRPALSSKRSWELFAFLRAQYEFLLPSFIDPAQRSALVEANVLNCMAICILDDVVDRDGELQRFELLQACYLDAACPLGREPTVAALGEAGRALQSLGQGVHAHLSPLPAYDTRRALIRLELAQGLHATRMQGTIACDLERTAAVMLEEYEEVHANSMFLKFTFACIAAATPSLSEATHTLLRRYIARAQSIYVLMYDSMNYLDELESGELCNLQILAQLGAWQPVSSEALANDPSLLHSTAQQLHARIQAGLDQLEDWATELDDAKVRAAHEGALRMFENHRAYARARSRGGAR